MLQSPSQKEGEIAKKLYSHPTLFASLPNWKQQGKLELQATHRTTAIRAGFVTGYSYVYGLSLAIAMAIAPSTLEPQSHLDKKAMDLKSSRTDLN